MSSLFPRFKPGFIAFSCLALLFSASVPSLSQTVKADDAGNETKVNPTGLIPAKDWQIDFGYLTDFHAGSHDALYYLLQYKGNRLFGAGDKPQVHTGEASPATADVAAPNGNDLTFKLERGSASLSGGIFDTLLSKPVLHSGFLKEVRGVLQVTGRTDFKQFNFAGGAESPNLYALNPFHYINQRIKNANVVNWLFVGALGENRNRAVSEGGNQDDLIFTYRAFAGKAILPVVDYGQPVKQRDADVKDVLAATTDNGTFSQAKFIAYFKKVRQAPKDKSDRTFLKFVMARIPAKPGDIFSPSEITDLQLNTLAAEHGTTYVAELNKFFVGAYRGKQRAPLGVWIESSGWYSAITAPASGSRFNNLFSANLQWYAQPRLEDSFWLKLRYESGRERANPNTDINFLSLTIGASF